jgi:hypothetical protein
MHPSVFGGAAAVLVLTWLLTRRRPATVLRSTDASAVAALNRAQISQVERAATRLVAVPLAAASSADLPAAEPVGPGLPARSALPRRGDARARAALLRELDQQLRGASLGRLAAIRLAVHWGDRSVLPLLHRGLRDVDPRVVLAAAQGMAGFRGGSASQATRQWPELPPLPPNAGFR